MNISGVSRSMVKMRSPILIDGSSVVGRGSELGDSSSSSSQSSTKVGVGLDLLVEIVAACSRARRRSARDWSQHPVHSEGLQRVIFTAPVEKSISGL